MCTEVNSAMGLQAAAATKRKHNELSFDSKDNTTYTHSSSPPPVKTAKWSLNNNNYLDSMVEEHQKQQQQKEAIQCINNNNTSIVNNNNNNNDTKSCEISCIKSLSSSSSCANSAATPVLNAIVATIPAAAQVDVTTPLPPTSCSAVPEDSIAKLESVASGLPCVEPWVSTASTEPVDCISKLQAVAVPIDPWGSIVTRSTLATTLLSADELDDDDDDFEDDYEEEESIIPTYCPLRYPFSATTQRSMGSNFAASSPQVYGSRPNYYSEPFPQQNCSRTGSPQHMRNFASWQNGSNSQFYSQPESGYTAAAQQQQTIRCAENGKSYLELGCTTPVATPSTINTNATVLSAPVATIPFSPMLHHHAAASHNETRHVSNSTAAAIKARCCDARSSWCNTNKNCYKDIRMKIRNLSMFKLSRFRQVSEQSLYRSVLICNTLKRIDREIEAEAKEMHQAVAQHHQQQQQQQHQLHQPQPHYHNLHSHMQHQPHLQSQSLNAQQHSNNNNSQQLMLHPQHQDYMPVLNCGGNNRLSGTIEYHHHHHQQQQQQQNFSQQQSMYQPERVDTPPPAASSYQQHSILQHKQNSANQFSHQQQNASTCMASASTTTTLHPYDHYPFRESQSGRATPFPTNCQSVITAATATTTTTPTQSQQTMPPAAAASSSASTTESAISSIASCSSSSTPQLITLTTATNNSVSSGVSSASSDCDSGYADDDSTRSINWSSVLSLSSQSALDPLNSNDLFSILPPSNPATAVPVSIPSSASVTASSDASTTSLAVAISGTFTTVQSPTSCSSAAANSSANSSSSAYNSCTTPPSATSTTATFTTLSTISSATHSLTSSYVSSMSSNSNSSSTWEYGFLDMEFGLGTEFTELVPSCKLSSDDLFKNSLTPVSSMTRYDNELEQPAHIMVGS